MELNGRFVTDYLTTKPEELYAGKNSPAGLSMARLRPQASLRGRTVRAEKREEERK